MDHEQGTHGGTNDKMAMKMDMAKRPYAIFAANLLISGIVMYFVMYTMIDSTAELYHNLNNVYMTMMMVTTMALLMLWMMPSMFPDRRTNIILNVLFGALFLSSLYGMRTQALVGDTQFLRAMIPHHSGAILMCEKSAITDPQIKQLCSGIVSGQKAEIAQMKALLER